MAVRQRFKPEERAAFQPGTVIEWLNGSHWQPGEITGALVTPPGERPYYPIKHTGRTTRTVSRGQEFWGLPGSIRLPQKSS